TAEIRIGNCIAAAICWGEAAAAALSMATLALARSDLSVVTAVSVALARFARGSPFCERPARFCWGVARLAASAPASAEEAPAAIASRREERVFTWFWMPARSAEGACKAL